MLYIVGGLLLLVVLFFVGSYNGFIRLRNMVQEAFSTMDVYLKKRYDLIPNLVNTVKGYATHEKETFTAVIEARNQAMSATTREGIKAGNDALSSTLGRLFALSESYPELKANQNFLELMDELQVVEGEIAESRKYYNAIVRQFNTRCEVIPHSIVASIFGFVKEPFFEVEDAGERRNVEVNF